MRQTLTRCRGVARLVVAHDTTEFNFGEDAAPRSGTRRPWTRELRLLRSLRPGHRWQRDESAARRFSASWSIDARGDKKSRRLETPSERDPEERAAALARALVDDVTETLGDSSAVHVMDREGDTYILLAHLVRNRCRFVVRMMRERREITGREEQRVVDTFAGAPVVTTREVPISARGRSLLPSYRAEYPERRARVATLHLSADRVKITRPKRAEAAPEMALSLNYVRVFEPSPPWRARPPSSGGCGPPNRSTPPSRSWRWSMHTAAGGESRSYFKALK